MPRPLARHCVVIGLGAALDPTTDCARHDGAGGWEPRMMTTERLEHAHTCPANCGGTLVAIAHAKRAPEPGDA